MSLFKRFLRSSQDGGDQRNSATPPPGMQAMGASLQRKFAKGVQYNSTCKYTSLCLSVSQSVYLSVSQSLFIHYLSLSLSLSLSLLPPPPPPHSVKVDWMTTRYVILFTSYKTLKYRNRQIRWQCCANRNSQIRWQCCANRNSQIRWQCYANRNDQIKCKRCANCELVQVLDQLFVSLCVEAV